MCLDHYFENIVVDDKALMISKVNQSYDINQYFQMNFLKYVMAKTFGVIPLQCLRSSVEDEQTVYVINQNLSTSPASFVSIV